MNETITKDALFEEFFEKIGVTKKDIQNIGTNVFDFFVRFDIPITMPEADVFGCWNVWNVYRKIDYVLNANGVFNGYKIDVWCDIVHGVGKDAKVTKVPLEVSSSKKRVKDAFMGDLSKYKASDGYTARIYIDIYFNLNHHATFKSFCQLHDKLRTIYVSVKLSYNTYGICMVYFRNGEQKDKINYFHIREVQDNIAMKHLYKELGGDDDSTEEYDSISFNYDVVEAKLKYAIDQIDGSQYNIRCQKESATIRELEDYNGNKLIVCDVYLHSPYHQVNLDGTIQGFVEHFYKMFHPSVIVQHKMCVRLNLFPQNRWINEKDYGRNFVNQPKGGKLYFVTNCDGMKHIKNLVMFKFDNWEESGRCFFAIPNKKGNILPANRSYSFGMHDRSLEALDHIN